MVVRLFGVVIALAVVIGSGIPVPGGAAPVDAAQGNGPFVGVWTEGYDQGVLADSKAGWTTALVSWQAIEPQDNAYAWGALDATLVGASGGGQRQVLASVTFTPSWAGPSICRVTTAQERAHLASFMAALVARYSGRQGPIPDGPYAGQPTNVKYWGLYNEVTNTNPNVVSGGCFGTLDASNQPTAEGPTNYARMIAEVGPTVHAVDSDAKVVFGGLPSAQFTGIYPQCGPTTGCPFDGAFLTRALRSLKQDLGALQQLDAVMVNFFSSQGAVWGYEQYGPDLVGRIIRLRQEMRDAGLTDPELKPIIVQESSYTSIDFSQPPPSTDDPTLPFNVAQRDYLVKTLARAASLDLLAIFWFKLQDSPPSSLGQGSDVPYGLRTIDGKAKPSYAAFRYFNGLIDRQDRFLARLAPTNPKLEGYDFTTRDGRRLQVVWNAVDTEVVSYPLPFGTAGAVTDPIGNEVGTGTPTTGVGAEPRFILSPGCTPRPNVGVRVAPAGPGQLQVTLTANTSAGVPHNRLTILRLGTGTNVRVDLPGGPSNVPGDVELALPSVASTTFLVRRAAPSPASALLRLTVTDACGPWQTFVGGGPGAWTGGASAQTEAPPQGEAPRTAPVACDPRPLVDVRTSQVGPGRLRTVVTAGGTTGQVANALRSIQVTRASNSTVEVPEQPGIATAQAGLGTDETITLAPDQARLVLLVQRTNPGAFGASLSIADGCSQPWPTFVGGGAAIP